MAWARSYTIWCDEPTCPLEGSSIRSEIGKDINLAEARAADHIVVWRGRDFCSVGCRKAYRDRARTQDKDTCKSEGE